MADRKKNGQFAPGHKPKGGRKPGVSTKSKAFREAVEPHSKEILEKLLELAREGNETALKQISAPYIPKSGQLAESCDKLELSGEPHERAWQLIQKYEEGIIDSNRVNELLSMYSKYAELLQNDMILNKLDDIRAALNLK